MSPRQDSGAPLSPDGPRLYVADERRFAAPIMAEDGLALSIEQPEFAVRIDGEAARLAPAGAGLFVNNREADQPTPLEHRSIIVVPGGRTFVFLVREDPGLSTVADLEQWILAMMQRRASEPRTRGVAPQGPAPRLPESFPLSPGRSLIGRDDSAPIRLPSIQVSRRHAAIERHGAGPAVVEDLGSFNGTFINGDRVHGPAEVQIGDRIDIGPVTLIYSGDHLNVQSTGESAELILDRVTYQLRRGGVSRTLLDGVSLAIRPREFTAIIGPSGSGKSLLLKTMSGRLVPTSGSVFLNRADLFAQFASLRQTIGYVPQRDILHESLSLNEALTYSARLRLPEDLGAVSRQERIRDLAAEVGLTEHLGKQIASLSGGQARRASLANEMLGRPGLLLLDEVTSGLDVKSDGELMQLFRTLAEGGKTVVLVTHNLYHLAETAHQVVVLSPGGELAYFGAPRAALKYFDVERIGREIYDRLESSPAAEQRTRYESSPDCTRFVRWRSPVLLTPTAPAEKISRTPLRQAAARLIREWGLLSRRSAAVKVAQPRWLFLLLIQSLGLAALMSWLFGDLNRLRLSTEERQALEQAPQLIGGLDLNEIPPLFRNQVIRRLEQSRAGAAEAWLRQKYAAFALRLLLSLAMCAMWLGCNNASSEIVRERSVFESEREVGIGVFAYLLAKLTFLAAVTCVQIFVLWSLVCWWTNLPGPAAAQLALLCLVGLVSVMLGLTISAWSRSSELSTALVPIAIIPQILLAGTMVPLDGIKLRLAEGLIPLHWGYRGLVNQLAFDDRTQELLKLVGAVRAHPASDGRAACIALAVHFIVLAALCHLGLRGAGRWWNFGRRGRAAHC